LFCSPASTPLGHGPEPEPPPHSALTPFLIQDSGDAGEAAQRDNAAAAWRAVVHVLAVGNLDVYVHRHVSDRGEEGEGASSPGDAKSSLGDAKCSLGDAESSLGDAESSLGDAKCSLGDAESSLGDAESSLGDA
jgi:hypothetical protein